MRWRKLMGKGRRRWAILVSEIIILLIIFLGVRAWMQRDLAGGAAPMFQSKLLDGEQVSLTDYRGRPVLVYFWASWCRVCRFEQGAIQAVAERWPVLTIAMQSGDAGSVLGYLAEQGLDWPTIVDEGGELARLFGVRGVPTSFVVGPEGEIRFREVGYTTAWGLRARLWLAGDPLGYATRRPMPDR